MDDNVRYRSCLPFAKFLKQRDATAFERDKLQAHLIKYSNATAKTDPLSRIMMSLSQSSHHYFIFLQEHSYLRDRCSLPGLCLLCI